MRARIYQDKIEQAYKTSGNSMGWRFLSCPAKNLEGAEVAFIGLNPGGSSVDADHGEIAMSEGSAYRDERWAGYEAGQSPLQKQVLSLFALLKQRPEDVLSGNLVPFRSPDWKTLADPEFSVRFGEGLWAEVLEIARPSLVVTMGDQATKSVCKLLNVQKLERKKVGWGNVSAKRGTHEYGTIVGLPHLSRFGIMNRDASKLQLQELFEGFV